jgi:uncharacterized membrane protein YsdA (DUF1294 family)
LEPIRTYGAVTFGAAFVLAVVLWRALSLDLMPSWLIAITLVAFLAHGYDKAIAGSDRTRVPEKVLLALTFAGGTIGTFLGRSLFRHKTRKASYRTQLRLVVGAQVILLIIFIVWVGPKR